MKKIEKIRNKNPTGAYKTCGSRSVCKGTHIWYVIFPILSTVCNLRMPGFPNKFTTYLLQLIQDSFFGQV